jgi:hypothetical protein
LILQHSSCMSTTPSFSIFPTGGTWRIDSGQHTGLLALRSRSLPKVTKTRKNNQDLHSSRSALALPSSHTTSHASPHPAVGSVSGHCPLAFVDAPSRNCSTLCSYRRLHLLRCLEISPSGEILLFSLIPTTFHSRHVFRSTLPSRYLPSSWTFDACILLLPQLGLSAKVTTSVARKQVSPVKNLDFLRTLAQPHGLLAGHVPQVAVLLPASSRPQHAVMPLPSAS